MSEHVVVLGASGGIGREVVRELVKRGHSVTGVARDAGRLQQLAERIDGPRIGTPRLDVLAQSVADEAGAAALARALRENGRPVTAVVASMRNPVKSGRLLDRPADDLRRILDSDVVANFIAARHLLPLLAESGRDPARYLVLSGPMASCAWSGYGHVSIAAAALQMLTRTLREEAKDWSVAVQQLQIGRPVRSETNRDVVCPDWIGADEVARHAVDLLERSDTQIPVVELGAYAPRAAASVPSRRAS